MTESRQAFGSMGGDGYFHWNSDCAKHRTPWATELPEHATRILRPCPRCVPELTVWASREGNVIHYVKTCVRGRTLEPMREIVAIQYDYPECKRCSANAFRIRTKRTGK